MKRVLLIGAYGNFGSAIAALLAPDPALQLILGGRDRERAAALAASVEAHHPPEAARIDLRDDLSGPLTALRPDIVVHTSGPFQGQDYRVARACIDHAIHYVDLADGRDFVAGIGALDEAARARGVLVCSGASSVPALTAAIVDHYRPAFATLERLDYGIATAQMTNRGEATVAGALSYAGKRFAGFVGGRPAAAHGWQGLRVRTLWGLGRRAMADCDIPDLALFPGRYPGLKTIRFQAGMELAGLQLGLWCLAGLVRLGLIGSLQPLAPRLLRMAQWFNALGSGDSGFYMKLSGTGPGGRPQERRFDLVARRGDGRFIPSLPAALMAKKLAAGEIAEPGARPCLGMLTLEALLAGWRERDIAWQERP